jgi:hypothetical protein
MDLIPHLAWPLSFDPVTGAYRSVQQDTTAELAANVAVICSFPIGYRDEAPEFGIEDPEFDLRPLDLTDIATAVSVYEPRARITITEDPVDPRDPGAASVHIEVAMPGGEDEPTSVEV